MDKTEIKHGPYSHRVYTQVKSTKGIGHILKCLETDGWGTLWRKELDLFLMAEESETCQNLNQNLRGPCLRYRGKPEEDWVLLKLQLNLAQALVELESSAHHPICLRRKSEKLIWWKITLYGVSTVLLYVVSCKIKRTKYAESRKCNQLSTEKVDKQIRAWFGYCS